MYRRDSFGDRRSKRCDFTAVLMGMKAMMTRAAIATVLKTQLLLYSQCRPKMLVETGKKKGKRKVQGVPQSQNAALPRPQEEEETDKSKQAQIEQTYEKH